MSVKPPPICKAFLICERILRDYASGDFSVINIVQGLRFARYSTKMPTLQCFAMLVEGIGDYLIELRVVRLNDAAVIFKENIGVMAFNADRSNAGFVTFAVSELLLESPGRYDFVLYANDGEIDRQVIRME